MRKEIYAGMNAYMAEQLQRRRRKLISIIPISDLQNIYRRVMGPHQNYFSAYMFRSMFLSEWEKYEEEIKNWISACWEGW